MIFFLGTHHPSWLRQTDVPLFISRRRLVDLKRPGPAMGPWALDSGGFSELSIHGRWTVGPVQYAEEVAAWSASVGRLQWAAAMDWMCEPWIIAKTGKTVAEHQELTIANYLELRRVAPSLPWVPVLQGWRYDDYMSHREQYAAAGVALDRAPVVGLGSVCRRQATGMAEELIRDLERDGIRLHGFGFKTEGLRRVAPYLHSADSMAWSLAARRGAPLPECQGRHRSCANCLRYALQWRQRVLAVIAGARRSDQPDLPFGTEAA